MHRFSVCIMWTALFHENWVKRDRKGEREGKEGGREEQTDGQKGEGGERKEEWMARLKQEEMKYLYLTSLFFDDPKAHTGNLLELINQFGKALGCKKTNI